jgi:hypothetical protein
MSGIAGYFTTDETFYLNKELHASCVNSLKIKTSQKHGTKLLDDVYFARVEKVLVNELQFFEAPSGTFCVLDGSVSLPNRIIKEFQCTHKPELLTENYNWTLPLLYDMFGLDFLRYISGDYNLAMWSPQEKSGFLANSKT